jgi:hypothetical protein
MVTVHSDLHAVRRAAIAVAITVMIPAVAEAQAVVMKAHRITCGTTTGPRVKCLTGMKLRSVRLIRDLGAQRQCRQRTNWGFDQSTIWVDRGCQAEFEVVLSASPPTQPLPEANTRRMPCGTISGAQMQCKTDGSATNVVLIRDLGGRSECRQSFNWGFTDSFIWTNRGCRAEFEVTYPSEQPADSTRRITCGTPTGARVSCSASGRVSNVVLIRDLTWSRRCRQNSTWGFTESDIWADQGCKAEFEVTYRAASPAGDAHRITCGTTTGAQRECKTGGEATNVVLIRDLSGRNLCRQGSNWGFTDSFIWANQGCRAQFEITYGGMVPFQ